MDVARRTLVALALMALGAAPAAHAANPGLASQLAQVEVAHAKLQRSFTKVALKPGAAPPGLASVSQDAAALASLTGELAIRVKKAGAKGEVLRRLGELEGEARRVSSQATALLANKRLEPVDVKTMSASVASLQGQFEAVLGLVEPIVSR